MKIPGKELVIALAWLALVGGGFAAFYFLAGPGAKETPQAPPAPPAEAAPPGPEPSPPTGEGPAGPKVGEEKREPAAEESRAEATEKPPREPKRVFADSFDGAAPEEWETFGESKTIAVERAGRVLRVKGASGSLDWDVAGLRTSAFELDGFSASVGFKLVSNRDTGTKMFFLCVEDPGNDEAGAWVYFHPTKGGREDPGYAAMKEGGPVEGVSARDGGKAFHTLRLSCARGKLAAFVDAEKIATYEMEFKKARFALGLKSPAEGEEVEGAFENFLLLDWPEKGFEP